MKAGKDVNGEETSKKGGTTDRMVETTWAFMSNQFFGDSRMRRFLSIVAIGAIVAALVFIIKPQAATSDIILLLSSSVVALIGVSITGYIFSSESLRKHTDDDYKYIYAAEKHKKNILSKLKGQFSVAVLLIVLFTVAAHFDMDEFISPFMFSVLMFFFTSFTIWSLSLDVRMMDVDAGLQIAARNILNEEWERLDKGDLIININPLEYMELAKNTGLSGNYDLTRECNVEDKHYIIRGFRGKEAQKIGERSDRDKTYLYRDMMDEFSPELALSVFEGIEKIICKIAEVSTDELHANDRKRLEAALGVGTGRKEDKGISDDIVDYYFMLAKYRDNFFIIETERAEEENIARQRIFSKHCCTGNLDADISSLSDTVSKPKHTRTGQITDYEYIYCMTPYIYVLRYELCKKLSGMDITNLNMASFDFSYGNMKKVLLNNTLLMESSFYSCNLSGANLSGCDLTDALFKYANCEDADFTHSKLSNNSFTKVVMHGAKFIGAELSNCLFPSIAGTGSNFEEASLVNCRMSRCNFPDSNFYRANIVMGNLEGTIFKDADMSKTKIASCNITDCNMYGCNFTDSTINFSTIKDTGFMISKYEDSEMSSNILIRDSFDNCQMKGVNFTGSQMFSCSFNSTQVSNCDFTKAMIMPYRIDKKVRRDYRKLIREGVVLLGKDGRHSVMADDINDFTNAFMKECLYTDAIIKYSDFTYAIMQRSIVSNTIYEYCLFSYGNLMDMYFADSRISNCLLNYTTLADTSMTSCVFRSCNFNSASMKNVTITGSSLIGCMFGNMDVKGLKIIDTTIEDTDLTGLLDNMKDVKGTIINVKLVGNNTYNGKQLPSRDYADLKDILKEVGIEIKDSEEED